MQVRRMSYIDAVMAWEELIQQIENAERELVQLHRAEHQAQAEVFYALHMEANDVEPPQ